MPTSGLAWPPVSKATQDRIQAAVDALGLKADKSDTYTKAAVDAAIAAAGGGGSYKGAYSGSTAYSKGDLFVNGGILYRANANIPVQPVTAPTYVGGTQFSKGAAGTAITLTVPTGVQTGDVLIAAVFRPAEQADLAVPSGWTRVPGGSYGSSAAIRRVEMIYKVAQAGDTPGTTINITQPSAQYAMAHVRAYRGAAAASLAASFTSTSGVTAGTKLNPVALTPTNYSAVVAQFFAWGDATSGGGATLVWSPNTATNVLQADPGYLRLISRDEVVNSGSTSTGGPGAVPQATYTDAAIIMGVSVLGSVSTFPSSLADALSLSASSLWTYVTAAAYTMLPGDTLLECVNSSATKTITLPSSASVPVGKVYTIKDAQGNAGTYPITVQRSGTDLIDVTQTKVIASNWGTLQVYSNGFSWFTVNGSTPRRVVQTGGGTYSADGSEDVIAYTGMSGSGQTVNLPLASSRAIGKPLIITDESGFNGAGGRTLTIQRAGSDTLDGGTATLSIYGGSITLYPIAGGWVVVRDAILKAALASKLDTTAGAVGLTNLAADAKPALTLTGSNKTSGSIGTTDSIVNSVGATALTLPKASTYGTWRHLLIVGYNVAGNGVPTADLTLTAASGDAIGMGSSSTLVVPPSVGYVLLEADGNSNRWRVIAGAGAPGDPGKVDKVTSGASTRVYGVNSADAQATFTATTVASPFAIPFRDSAGRVKFAPAAAAGDAVTLEQMDTRQPGQYALPSIGSVATTTQSASIRVARFVAVRNMTIKSIGFGVNSAATADDAVELGLYDASGNRIVTSGSQTGLVNTSGMKKVTIADTAIIAGTVYYAAFSYGAIGGTAAGLAAVSVPTSAAALLAPAQTLALPYVEVFIVGAGALPATLGTPSQGSFAPLMALRESA